MLASLLSIATAATAVQAVYLGFNYDVASDHKSAFVAQKSLQGTSGFTSARLYTMIAPNSQNSPASAIQAAIDTNTTLLLGLWASSGQSHIDDELAALQNAISQHGSSFTDLVIGISVGSEDLYRISPTGIANKENPGTGPDEIVSYIQQTRAKISGTALSNVPVGHVDTWTAWTNGSNAAVIDAVDFLGFDGYPYFQKTDNNAIENAKSLFFQSYDATVAVAKGKTVWVTETGWPVSASEPFGAAVASVENAQRYWDEVGCALFDKVPVFWYTFSDAGATPSFGVVDSDASTQPRYNLTCPAGSSFPTAIPSQASQSATSSASNAATTLVSVAGGSGSNATTPTSPAMIPTGTGSAGTGSGSGTGSSPIPTTTRGATNTAVTNTGSIIGSFIAMVAAIVAAL